MKHPTPDPPELGERDGLAYALFLPDSEPVGGVAILHGAGSAKESHFDFGRLCRDYDMAAVAYDARGHGRSTGEWGPTAFGDALAMCDLLREHAPAVALRGSSMGGFTAIHAAALDPAVGRRRRDLPGAGRPAGARRAIGQDHRTSRSTPPRRRGCPASTPPRPWPRWAATRRCCCFTRRATSRSRGR